MITLPSMLVVALISLQGGISVTQSPECASYGEAVEHFVNLQSATSTPFEVCHEWELQPYICRIAPLFRPEAEYIPAKYQHDLHCVLEQEPPSTPQQEIS